jgi:hypothetical protein
LGVGNLPISVLKRPFCFISLRNHTENNGYAEDMCALLLVCLIFCFISFRDHEVMIL